MKFIATFCIAFIFLSQVESQVPDFSKVENLNPGDSANITSLIRNGIKIRCGKVIGWFPKDSLTRKQMRTILDTLDTGINAAHHFMKSPLDWQVHSKGNPYTYYFRRDTFISHASSTGFVSIPFYRLKGGRTPWLHEAMHVMFVSKLGSWHHDTITEEEWATNMPLWLAEGLPEYVSLIVSEQLSYPKYDPFTDSFNTRIDSLCREDLKGPKSESILPYIGGKGVIKELFSQERRLYAPTFYHCSCSFVKFIAEQSGVDPLIHAIASFRNELSVLQKEISIPLQELKKQWLINLESN